jgi:hypothetical protein
LSISSTNPAGDESTDCDFAKSTTCVQDVPGKTTGGARNKISQQMIERKKTSFIYHFLAPQPDE